MNNVLPYPESHTFFEVLCCLAGILGVVLLAKRCWNEFLGGKNEGDDAPVPRREFEAFKREHGDRIVSELVAVRENIAALNAASEARSESFNATISAILKTNSENISRLHERISELERHARERR